MADEPETPRSPPSFADVVKESAPYSSPAEPEKRIVEFVGRVFRTDDDSTFLIALIPDAQRTDRVIEGNVADVLHHDMAFEDSAGRKTMRVRMPEDAPVKMLLRASQLLSQEAAPPVTKQDVKPDPIKHQDPIKQQDPIKHQDPIKQQDPIKHQDPIKQQDPVKHDPVKQQDPIKHQDPIKQQDPIKHQDPIKQQDPVKHDPVKQQDPIKHQDPIKQQDPIKHQDPIKQQDPKPDPIKQDPGPEGGLTAQSMMPFVLTTGGTKQGY